MTYLIAETGINHDGREVALRDLVQFAHFAGCDAVKFQLFDWQTIKRDERTKQILRRVQLPLEAIASAAQLAKKYRMDRIVTPFGHDMLIAAEAMGCWDAYKVSHAECEDHRLIEAMLATGRRVIVSYPPGIEPRKDVTALWCCPKYPTPIEEVDWKAVGRIGGFSDHTANVNAGRMAAEAGANVIEFHITANRNSLGPDHWSSIQIGEIDKYVDSVRSVGKQQVAA